MGRQEMTEYSYRNYVLTLSKKVAANLSTIETEHNFEYGSEFEIAVCQVLRSALADRFGIARGYVVNADGNAAGDDIVIFERSRFPTLALRDRDDYARKEFIPIEAVYCYIEAKHTLNLEGTDPQSFSYACEQISRVKELCSSRPSLSPNQIAPYLNVGAGITASTPPDFPTILNPMFCVLLARQVRRKKGDEVITDPGEIESILTGLNISSKEAPDIIILGENNLILPTLPDEQMGGSKLRSPFFIPGRSRYHIAKVDGGAFGVGLISIMAALDWIQLGVMPWHKILVDALGIPYE